MLKRLTQFKIIWLCICIFFLFVVVIMEEKKDSSDIVINEVCNNNFSNYYDSMGNYLNWIELYNPTDSVKSLDGYEIMNHKRKDKYEFDDVELGPHEYITILFGKVDEEDIAPDALYAGFSLDFGEETIYLNNAENRVIDMVEIPELDVNSAYARTEDGGAKWQEQLATPLESNNNQTEIIKIEATEGVSKPQLSVTSGFYEEAFDLSIVADSNVSVYYTLDGNIPDENSYLYTGKIRIEDASLNPNVYSLRTDTTAQFYTDERIVLPDKLLDKATVIRAVSIDEYGNRSEVETATYFVGFQNKEAYADIKVISLVSDYENLFGYDKGIYVTGKTYDGIQIKNDWLWMKSNYRNKGRSAEREVHMELFDEQHNLVLDKEAGIRIRGKGTRAYLQKSFNLFAREEYDGEPAFAYDFWDDGDVKASEISLSSGGNDLYTKMKDYLAANLSGDMQFSVLRHQPCMVFLNGEYWGMYYITEKFNAQYIEKYYGIPEENVVMIRNWVVEEGDEEDLQKLHEDMEYIGSMNLTLSENYKKACELIDIESAIDYYAYQVYIARYGDWLGEPHEGGNWGVWKADVSGMEYGDDKWRWLFFDANSASMSSAEFDSFSYIEQKSYYNVFPNLMKNAEFREKFYEKLDYLRTFVFAPDKVNEQIDQIKEETQLQVVKTYDRFLDETCTKESYEDAVNVIKAFYEQRYYYISEMLNQSTE